MRPATQMYSELLNRNQRFTFAGRSLLLNHWRRTDIRTLLYYGKNIAEGNKSVAVESVAVDWKVLNCRKTYYAKIHMLLWKVSQFLWLASRQFFHPLQTVECMHSAICVKAGKISNAQEKCNNVALLASLNYICPSRLFMNWTNNRY